MHWKHYQIIATKSECPQQLRQLRRSAPATCLDPGDACQTDAWRVFYQKNLLNDLTVFNDTWRLRQPSCSAAVWAAFCGPSWRSSSSSCSGSCPVCCSSSALGIFQPAAAFSCQLESRIIERTVIKTSTTFTDTVTVYFLQKWKENQFLSTFLFSWLPS